jgi:exopolysaccharide biosynthesis polyprenyl glycosylphosphotransferase
MAIALAFLEVGGLLALLGLSFAWNPSLMGQPAAASGVAPILAFSLTCALAFRYFNLYDLRVVRTWAEFAPRFTAALTVAIALAAASQLALPRGLPKTPLFYLVVLVCGLVFPVRAIAFLLLRRPAFARRVLLVGQGPLAECIRYEVSQASGYRLVGVLAPPSSVDTAVARPAEDRSGVGETLARSVVEHRPDVVVVALPERRGQLPTNALLHARAQGTQIAEGTEFLEEVAGKAAVESLNPSQLIFCSDLTQSRGRLLVHRAVSLLAAILGIVLTAPLMAFAAVLVKLESEGPVFFVQKRVGLHGRVFRLLKFRTMRGHPSRDGGVWSRHDEARITPLGRFLRHSRIDELPQFFNILAGDMNLVGPRPEMADNVDTMTAQIPFYVVRHTIPPGVTGWAQVRQGYAVTYEEVLEKTCYDLYYIKHMSLALDLRILVETARIMLLPRGKTEAR